MTSDIDGLSKWAYESGRDPIEWAAQTVYTEFDVWLTVRIARETDPDSFPAYGPHASLKNLSNRVIGNLLDAGWTPPEIPPAERKNPVSLIRVFDAARPPATAPPGCAGVLGYIGKPGFTPHTWSASEWRRFQHLKQYPVWVPDLAAEPALEARAAVAAARTLGWAPHLPEPRTRVIVCDLETRAVPAWYSIFAAEVSAGEFVSVAYGSLTTIAANLASDLWVAAWDGDPKLEPGQVIHAHQYQAGQATDLSVADEWLSARGGVGPRHG